MSYAGMPPAVQALMWAWEHTKFNENLHQRQETAEKLAAWLLSWKSPNPTRVLDIAHKYAPNQKNNLLTSITDPLAPIENWKPTLLPASNKNNTSLQSDPVSAIESLQEFINSMPDSARATLVDAVKQIATPDASPNQAGAAARGVVPAASPAMVSMPAHQPNFDELSPSGYR